MIRRTRYEELCTWFTVAILGGRQAQTSAITQPMHVQPTNKLRTNIAPQSCRRVPASVGTKIKKGADKYKDRLAHSVPFSYFA
jgi:hypothetical protein